MLELSVARMEAPVFLRLHAAWRAGDAAGAARWNALFLASRESAELRAESAQMGYSLARLLAELDVVGAARRLGRSLVSGGLRVRAPRAGTSRPDAALTAYLWAWAENQVLAAVKTVPLGQTDGQKDAARAGVAAARHR